MTERPPELAAAADAVLTFLESVGHRSEAELYLRLFRELPRQSFALIGVEAPVIRHALGSLTEQLAYLEQLGLVAPLVAGLFDPLAAAPAIERLVRRLPAVGLRPELLDAEGADLPARLLAALDDGALPIVSFAPEPGVEPRQRFERLAALALALETRKVVILRRRGALRLQARRSELGAPSGVLSVVNLRADGDALLAPRALCREDRAMLGHARELTERGPPGLLVNVTTPFDLLKELFTVKGAGTLIKAGSDLERHTSYRGVDLPRLTRLLETSFGRRLRPAFLQVPPRLLVLERAYRGVAIVHDAPAAPYLTKFAVEPVAQGEGMGQDLWRALARELPRLYWRARPENPIARWYSSIADGCFRTERWHVFWRGLAVDEVPAVVTEALQHPTDFVEAPVEDP